MLNYTDRDIIDLVHKLRSKGKEPTWVEFKCNNKNPEMIGEYISAISNVAALEKRHCGYLIWGIDDTTHEVVGTSFDFDAFKIGNEDIVLWLTRQLDPIPYISYRKVELDDKSVGVLKIAAATSEPTKFRGIDYIRRGEHKKKLKDCPDLEKELWKVGVHILPRFAKDTTDRNRTSPFAFTGNKFEFRMLGSDLSISGPNIILNTIVAEELSQFADVLEGAKDFSSALDDLIRKTIAEHKRIIFNGNNYSEEWEKEAECRGLLNLRTTPDALPSFIAPKNIELFTKHKIFTVTELHSRYEILMEVYVKRLNIEALTMSDMVKRQILPAITRYANDLTQAALNKKAFSESIDTAFELSTVKKLSSLCRKLTDDTEALEFHLDKTHEIEGVTDQANYIRDVIIPDMSAIRAAADEAELLTGAEYWPFPTYTELLFSIR